MIMFKYYLYIEYVYAINLNKFMKICMCTYMNIYKSPVSQSPPK